MAHKRKIPLFLEGIITQEDYTRWLERKAEAHLRRDRKRGHESATRPSYKDAIHKAVHDSKGFDTYTGERLAWSQLSTYCNIKSKEGRHLYKETFALLPTVDHVDASSKIAEFRICSWRTNSAKNDLSLASFIDLCQKVLAHAGNLQT